LFGQHVTTMLSAAQTRDAMAAEDAHLTTAAETRLARARLAIAHASHRPIPSLPATTPLGSAATQSRSVTVATRRLLRITNGEVFRESENNDGSLMDGGANGGLFSYRHVVVIETTDERAKVVGVGDGVVDSLSDLEVGNGITLTHDIKGNPVLLFLCQYAFHHGERSVHSAQQVRQAGHDVDDRPVLAPVPGRQCVICSDGTIIPFAVRRHLCYMPVRKPTDAELEDESIPHVFFTLDAPFEPDGMDLEVDDAAILRSQLGIDLQHRDVSAAQRENP